MSLIATTTTLTSSRNPQGFSHPVLLSATVAGVGGTPSGTVQFKDAGVNLGTAQAMTDGVATYSTSSLTLAIHTLTAIYSGDSLFATSTSSPLSQVVGDSVRVSNEEMVVGLMTNLARVSNLEMVIGFLPANWPSRVIVMED